MNLISSHFPPSLVFLPVVLFGYFLPRVEGVGKRADPSLFGRGNGGTVFLVQDGSLVPIPYWAAIKMRSSPRQPPEEQKIKATSQWFFTLLFPLVFPPFDSPFLSFHMPIQRVVGVVGCPPQGGM